MEHDDSGFTFLKKLRESKPPHPRGFNCVTSDNMVLRIPYVGDREHDRWMVSLFPPSAKRNDGAEKEKVDALVAKLIKALQHQSRQALLLLGELGPQAAPAVPEIRRIMAEGHKSLVPIAAMALAKIEK